MDVHIPAVPVSPLRQRLIDDMTMRRFSQETQRNYIRDVGRFASFLGRPRIRRRPRICAVSRSTSARPAFRCRP